MSQDKAWSKLSEVEQSDLVRMLHALGGTDFQDKPSLAKKLGPVPKPIEKSLWGALAVRDESAPILTSKKGESEPDPDLRDSENVPLPTERVAWTADPAERLASLTYYAAVDRYMEGEVLLFVPDAWVDHDRTKIGYEIPLTRDSERRASGPACRLNRLPNHSVTKSRQ
jgi:type I restriction enzyme M protein